VIHAKTIGGWALGFVLAVVPRACMAGWTSPTSGTANYLDPARWAGGVIDNRFESTLKLSGTLSVRLDARHSTGPEGLLLGYDVVQTSYEFNLVGNGTLVLSGPVNMTPVKSDVRATIGGAFESLGVELEGTCQFNIGPWRYLTIVAPIGDGMTPGALLKTGEGHLILSGSNSYSGGTTIRDGRVQLARSEVLPDMSLVELSPTAGVLELLAGASETIGALSGGSTDKGNVILNGARLLVGAADVPAVYRGVISGSGGSVAKIGAAVQTFTNVAHSFTGELTVRAGTLSIEAA
jgi:autotransporter-associated beta strand protein